MRRVAALTLLGGVVLFVAVLLAAVPWQWSPDLHPWPGGDPTPVLTSPRLAAIEDYASRQRLLSWAALALGLMVSAALGFTRLGSRLVARVPGPDWLRLPLTVAALLGVVKLATIWLRWWQYRNATLVGINTQTTASWLRDQALGWTIEWVLTCLLIGLLIVVARRAPRTWPAVVGLIAAGLTVTGSLIYPLVIEPMFNHFRPLPDGPVRSAVLQIADREGVAVDQVLVADASRRTTTFNAYVSGIGPTRRVVLYDTLLKDADLPETSIVVAHELAHAKHNDVVTGTALGALGAISGFGLLGLLLSSPRLIAQVGAKGPGDLSVVPLVLALSAVGALLTSPLQTLPSRAMEVRADVVSLEATGDPQAFVDLHLQLIDRAWSDPNPPAWSQFWFGTHPTPAKRLGLLDHLAGQGA